MISVVKFTFYAFAQYLLLTCKYHKYCSFICDHYKMCFTSRNMAPAWGQRLCFGHHRENYLIQLFSPIEG